MVFEFRVDVGHTRTFNRMTNDIRDDSEARTLCVPLYTQWRRIQNVYDVLQTGRYDIHNCTGIAKHRMKVVDQMILNVRLHFMVTLMLQWNRITHFADVQSLD